MSNHFLSKENIKKLEESIVKFVNDQSDYLYSDSLNDPRSVGGALQGIIEENFESIVSNSNFTFQTKFTRRGMADLAFSDQNGINYIIDVKSHNLDTDFNMPNLTANRGLIKLYETENKEPENYFILLMFGYKIVNSNVFVESVKFVPIEKLDWSCLTIGALGWGQIQIKNSNKIIINNEITRKEWMIELCEKMLEFYPNEIVKINKRITYFQSAKKYWESKK